MHLAQAGASWDGQLRNSQGTVKSFLPWDVAGAAATLLRRGQRRGRVASAKELERFVADFTLLDHPVEHAGDTEALLRMVSRGLSSQWLFQRYPLNTIARTVALFEQTPLPDGRPFKVLRPGWQERLLGSSVSDYCSAGFLMNALASQGLPYPFTWSDADLPLIFPDQDSNDMFDEIVRRHFLTTTERFLDPIPRLAEAAEAWGVEEFDLEPWGFNLLQDRPFVGGISRGSWIAPCAPIVLQKASATSIAYAGLKYFDNAFTDELGHLFQAYIGRHLSLIEGVDLYPEISFTRSKQLKHSADWILVTPAATFLIECKSAFPDASIREGRATMLEPYRRVIGKGIDQINKTATLIRQNAPEFAGVPVNRPIIGLVVTLGDYDLANNEGLRSELTPAKIPIAAVSSEFLERLAGHPVAVWNRIASLGQSAVGASNAFEVRHVLDSHRPRRNPIIDGAWNSIPIVQRLGSRLNGYEADRAAPAWI